MLMQSTLTINKDNTIERCWKVPIFYESTLRVISETMIGSSAFYQRKKYTKKDMVRVIITGKHS